MARNMLRTGKQNRPKTAIKGKRYHCAMCRKRSPKPVKTPAPWYCPSCFKQKAVQASDFGLSPPSTFRHRPEHVSWKAIGRAALL
jgi:hypothetical protein